MIVRILRLVFLSPFAAATIVVAVMITRLVVRTTSTILDGDRFYFLVPTGWALSAVAIMVALAVCGWLLAEVARLVIAVKRVKRWTAR